MCYPDAAVVVSENNNTKTAAPPADPPPPPPAAAGSHQEEFAEFNFNLELTRNQHEQYGTQFSQADPPSTIAPSVTIVGKWWRRHVKAHSSYKIARARQCQLAFMTELETDLNFSNIIK